MLEGLSIAEWFKGYMGIMGVMAVGDVRSVGNVGENGNTWLLVALGVKPEDDIYAKQSVAYVSTTGLACLAD
jgi:hypothetical protein